MHGPFRHHSPSGSIPSISSAQVWLSTEMMASVHGSYTHANVLFARELQATLARLLSSVVKEVRAGGPHQLEERLAARAERLRARYSPLYNKNYTSG